jgi:3-carboxy-cis,cis-muconate cycloisomerase
LSFESLFRAIFVPDDVREAVSGHAWLQAMLAAERALAAASGVEGVAEACDASLYDVEALAREGRAAGNPVEPLVRALRERSGVAEAHRGATSQDILDTAAMLVARDARALILAELDAAARACAELADRHRSTVMAARTLMQQAVPTTFGLKAAGWLRGLDGAAARLSRVRSTLPVQLGGPVGALGGFGAEGLRLVEVFAAELDLAPAAPWHTCRLPVADLAGALGAACGVTAKVAGDIVLLAQQEVAEVREDAPGRGGSSSMDHKQNPVAAISARAAARRGPALAGHLLACMDHEHERAAGAWHAEWLPLRDLLRTTGSAAAWLDDSLACLVVDADRMAANLGSDPPPVDTAAVDLLVDNALAGRPGAGGSTP